MVNLLISTRIPANSLSSIFRFHHFFELVHPHTPGGAAPKRALAGARTCPHCL